MKLLERRQETPPWENLMVSYLQASSAYSDHKAGVLSHWGWWKQLDSPCCGLPWASGAVPFAESSLPPTDMAFPSSFFSLLQTAKALEVALSASVCLPALSLQAGKPVSSLQIVLSKT